MTKAAERRPPFPGRLRTMICCSGSSSEGTPAVLSIHVPEHLSEASLLSDLRRTPGLETTHLRCQAGTQSQCVCSENA